MLATMHCLTTSHDRIEISSTQPSTYQLLRASPSPPSSRLFGCLLFSFALFSACPGLSEQRPDIPFQQVVGVKDVVPTAWQGEFEVAFFDCEHNPFNSKPFFNEVGPNATGTEISFKMMMLLDGVCALCCSCAHHHNALCALTWLSTVLAPQFVSLPPRACCQMCRCSSSTVPRGHCLSRTCTGTTPPLACREAPGRESTA